MDEANILEKSRKLLKTNIGHLSEDEIEEIIEHVMDDSEVLVEEARKRTLLKGSAASLRRSLDEAIERLPVDKMEIRRGLQDVRIEPEYVAARINCWLHEAEIRHVRTMWVLSEIGKRFEIALNQADVRRGEYWCSLVMIEIIPEGKGKERMETDLKNWTQLQTGVMSMAQLRRLTPHEEKRCRSIEELDGRLARQSDDDALALHKSSIESASTAMKEFEERSIASKPDAWSKSEESSRQKIEEEKTSRWNAKRDANETERLTREKVKEDAKTTDRIAREKVEETNRLARDKTERDARNKEEQERKAKEAREAREAKEAEQKAKEKQRAAKEAKEAKEAEQKAKEKDAKDREEKQRKAREAKEAEQRDKEKDIRDKEEQREAREAKEAEQKARDKEEQRKTREAREAENKTREKKAEDKVIQENNVDDEKRVRIETKDKEIPAASEDASEHAVPVASGPGNQ